MVYKKRLRILFIAIIVIIVSSGFLSAATLKKVYYHKKDQYPVVEPGQISLYFDQEPEVVEQKGTTLANGFIEQEFILPKMTIQDGKVNEMIRDVNKRATIKDYTVAIINNEKEHLVKLKITYNPEKFSLVWDFFDAITEDKGFMIHFYDRLVLQSLKNREPTLIRMTSNGGGRVLLDCGHGGTDTGGIGLNGIQEKDICLQLGLMVAAMLKKNGIDVMLTRDNDVDLSLPERTCHAHPHNADLFISIHANHALNAHAQGIETFYLSHRALTHHDNHLTFFEKQQLDSHRTTLQKKSSQLAQSIHTCVLKKSREHQSSVDRKVKTNKTSQILVASEVPTTLVEVGFLSHPHEGKLLRQKTYLSSIAHGIVLGIKDYLSASFTKIAF